MECPNCGREVFGFWKLGEYVACSHKCFRDLIQHMKIPRLNPNVAHPALGIAEPRENAA